MFINIYLDFWLKDETPLARAPCHTTHLVQCVNAHVKDKYKMLFTI